MASSASMLLDVVCSLHLQLACSPQHTTAAACLAHCKKVISPVYSVPENKGSKGVANTIGHQYVSKLLHKVQVHS
jgi:hypothetical protein